MKLFLDWMGPDTKMEEIPLATAKAQAVVNIIIESSTGQRFEIHESIAADAFVIRSLDGRFSVDILCGDRIKIRAGL